MIRYHVNKKGVTLIELLAVIVVFGILTAIAFVVIGSLISRTSTKAYQETVNSLNKATKNYILWDNITTEDAFEGLQSNSSRISILLQQGYISKVTHPNACTSSC